MVILCTEQCNILSSTATCHGPKPDLLQSWYVDGEVAEDLHPAVTVPEMTITLT